MAESIRLTNDTRDQIRKKAITHRFRKSVVKLMDKQATFTDEVYNDLYGPLVQKRMEELPQGWLHTMSSFHVKFGGSAFDDINFDGDYNLHGNARCAIPTNRAKADSRRFLATHSSRHHPVKAYEANHP